MLTILLSGMLREIKQCGMAMTTHNELGNHVLFQEDCLDTAKRLDKESVDLIYADPPFFTGRLHSMNGCSFSDNWTTTEEYLSWMEPRLREFRRILKPTGTIYIHCDWHISHYLKVLSDRILGMNNFINEVVWKRQTAHSDAKQGGKHYGRIHDTILVYGASQEYCWNQQYVPYNNIYLEKTYKHVESTTDRRFALGDLTGPGGAAKGNPSYEFLGVTRYWRYSKVKMTLLLRQGRIVHQKGKVPLLKRYLDEMRGKAVQDLWLDISIGSCKRNRYPTQKPEELLERIIEVSSNPGETVYEAFAGSSTGGVVCHRLHRRWLGSEMSKDACSYSIQRLRAAGCTVKLILPSLVEATGTFDLTPNELILENSRCRNKNMVKRA